MADRYVMISQDDMYQFQNAINALLQDGWELSGETSHWKITDECGDRSFSKQALILKEAKDGPNKAQALHRAPRATYVC